MPTQTAQQSAQNWSSSASNVGANFGAKITGVNPNNVTNPIRNDRQAYGIYDLKNPTGLADSKDTSPVISADTLNQTLNPPIIPTPPTTNTNLGAMIETNATQSQTQSDAEKKRQEALDAKGGDITSKFNELLGVNTELGGVSGTADRKRQDTAKKQSDKLNAQILANSKATRDRIENVRKNFIGSPAGAQQEIGRIERESANYGADLALQKYVADNDYQGAKEIADRQVELKTFELKAKADNLKAYIEFNKADFDKEEERIYDEAQKKVDAELKKKTDNEKAIADMKLKAVENGLTNTSVLTSLSQIDTDDPKAFDKALAIASPYLATLTTDIVKLDNGTTLLIDKRTGKTIHNFGGGSGASDLPTGTPENIKGLASVGSLVGGFSSVNAQRMFTKNINDLAIKGDEKGLAEKIVGQTLNNIETPEIRKRAVGGFLLAQELTKMQTLLNEYEAKGGKTNILRGSIQDVKQRLGAQGDPELANLATQMTIQLDNLARARTGAVITENEEKLYGKVLPSIGKNLELNTALISGLKTSLMGDVEENLRYNLTSDGLNMIKGTLPEVFDYDDSYLNSFSPENINKTLPNKDYFNNLP